MRDRDQENDDDRDSNPDASDQSEAPSASPRAETASTSASATSEKPERTRSAKTSRSGKSSGSARARDAKPLSTPKTSSMPVARAALFVVVALAAGAAAGWFGHIQQAKAKLRAESVPAAAGSAGSPAAGPCGAWEKKICDGSGATSAACQQAKAGAELLTPSACEVALSAVPATLAKVKAARATCDQLVTKLCADLKPGSPMCDMVKERTPSFPPQQCEEMMKSYDKVIGELRTMEQQQGGMQMGADPHGAPPGAAPQGAPPMDPH